MVHKTKNECKSDLLKILMAEKKEQDQQIKTMEADENAEHEIPFGEFDTGEEYSYYVGYADGVDFAIRKIKGE